MPTAYSRISTLFSLGSGIRISGGILAAQPDKRPLISWRGWMGIRKWGGVRPWRSALARWHPDVTFGRHCPPRTLAPEVARLVFRQRPQGVTRTLSAAKHGEGRSVRVTGCPCRREEGMRRAIPTSEARTNTSPFTPSSTTSCRQGSVPDHEKPSPPGTANITNQCASAQAQQDSVSTDNRRQRFIKDTSRCR